MPRIINSFRQENPFATTIQTLGKVMFADKSAAALRRAQTEAAMRENYGIEELARLASQHGQIFDPNQAAEAAILGGIKPADLATMQTFLSGNLHGPRDARTTNAMAGEGEYGKSAEAFDIDQGNAMERHRISDATSRYNIDTDAATSRANNAATLANDWRKFESAPKEAIGPDGNPVFIAQGQLTQPGVQPILNNNQKNPIDLMRGYLQAAEAAGLAPEQANEYALTQISKSKGLSIGTDENGNLSVEMGGPAFTKPTQTKLEGSDLATRKFMGVLSSARSVAEANPNIFGIPGMARQGVQDAREVAGSIARIIGVDDIEGTLGAIQNDVIAKGGDPSIFSAQYDPALGQIESLSKIMAYQGAAAIAGQSGRDVSDKDVANINMIFGDPRDWAMNQQKFLTKLKQVEDYVMQQRQIEADFRAGKPMQQPVQGEAAPPQTGDQADPLGIRIVR